MIMQLFAVAAAALPLCAAVMPEPCRDVLGLTDGFLVTVGPPAAAPAAAFPDPAALAAPEPLGTDGFDALDLAGPVPPPEALLVAAAPPAAEATLARNAAAHRALVACTQEQRWNDP
jgi:hypothetical protein